MSLSVQRRATQLTDESVDRVDTPAQSLGEFIFIERLVQADADSTGFVAIGRADALPRRAEIALAAPIFTQAVDNHMVRQDKMRPVGDVEPIADVDTARFQTVNLFDQLARIEHDAVADDALDIFTHRARRQEMQGKHFVADHDRMPGVGTALTADDEVGIIAEKIDDFPFAFVAPLQSQNCGYGHR